VYRLKWAPEVAGTDDIDAAGKDVEGEGDADESGVSIAFRADLTRVVTFLGHARGHDARLSRDRRLRRTPSHHAPQYNPEQMEKGTRINEYHTAQLAGWLGRLKATAGGDGNTLDACASKDDTWCFRMLTGWDKTQCLEDLRETLFFGPELAERVRERGSPRVPEWTGLWWQRRDP
jgi:hypothetical protein